MNACVSDFARRQEEVFSLEQIGSIQEAAWLALYRYAFEKSPFYGEHLKAAGLSPHSPPSLADMGTLPMTDKDCLSERTSEFICVPDRQVVDVVTTSGSTGHPLVAVLTEADLNRLGYNEYLSFRCADLTAEDRVLLAVTLDRCFMAGMAYFLGLRTLGASVIRVGASLPAMHLETIQRLKPTAVVGVPSFLRLVAQRASESGFDLVGSSVRKLVCIGEPVRTTSMELNKIGRDLEACWGAKVFSTYGSTELATSLCECRAGLGNHIHPELLYLETVDEQGNPTAPGEEGELVATTFRMEAMPLIRYRTGDYARLISEPCPCGRLTQRISPILGRKNHKLKVKGATLFPSTLQVVLEACPELASYVILVRNESDLSDHIEIKVCWNAGCGEHTARLLRDRLQAEAKVVPTISEASAEEIESLQMPEGARKRRFFVDLRTKARE
ncbi:MAG: AMP-binding protein [Verrucomicrobia bacterium]|nr:AMP-binding protein [Verrucomicrobiota bacterium]